MKGRPMEVDAIRRGRTPATELALIENAEVIEANPALDGYAVKPSSIAEKPALDAMWDQVVGDGRAYKPQDVPLLTQMVYWMAVADEIMHQDEEEEPSPTRRLRNLAKASDYSLKLAEHFGATPMARARLGLTKAAAVSIGEDIRLKVIEAMDQMEAKGIKVL